MCEQKIPRNGQTKGTVESKMLGKKKKTLDPLFSLFEHYLVTRSYENAGEFTRQLAEEYLLYLDSTPAHIPFEVRAMALEDLASEAHEMLVKKLYGCVDSSEYENFGTVAQITASFEIEYIEPEIPGNPPQEK
jgi:hypothetical protein